MKQVNSFSSAALRGIIIWFVQKWQCVSCLAGAAQSLDGVHNCAEKCHLSHSSLIPPLPSFTSQSSLLTLLFYSPPLLPSLESTQSFPSHSIICLSLVSLFIHTSWYRCFISQRFSLHPQVSASPSRFHLLLFSSSLLLSPLFVSVSLSPCLTVSPQYAQIDSWRGTSADRWGRGVGGWPWDTPVTWTTVFVY